jgi:hypothetical protein
MSVEESRGVNIRLTWDASDIPDSIYVDQLQITHTDKVFVLVFGETMLPFLMPEQELPEQISIRPVTKLVVTAEDMKLFYEVIRANVEKFIEREASNARQDS